MKMLWTGVFLLPLFSTAVTAQEVQASKTRSFSVENLATGADKSISYLDEKNQPIRKQAFLRAIAHGRQFSFKRDEVHHSTAFMLLSRDAKDTAKAASILSAALHGHYRIEPGQELPAFQLSTLDGGHVDNTALKDKPTLVQFFFADCVPCFAENPALNAYAKAHPEVRVLAMTRGDAKTAEAYIQQRQLAWPVAYGAQTLLDTLGVSVFPTIALVGADGRLLDIIPSGGLHSTGDTMSEQDLNLWVRHALSQHDRPMAHSALP